MRERGGGGGIHLRMRIRYTSKSHTKTHALMHARRCVFAECGKYIDLHDLKQHKQTCEFGVYRECQWCFQQVPFLFRCPC